MKKFVLFAMLIATASFAHAASKKSAAPAPTVSTTPTLTPEMKKAMELGAPSEGHKALEPFIGKWKNHVKHWMKPEEAPQESDGTNENTWILGGRFVQQKYTANWNGMPFEGLGFTGYDNIRGEYQSLWLDNMMTGMMFGTGSFDKGYNAVKIKGEFSCPMTGDKKRPFRSEWKVINKDTHAYVAYDKSDKGKEFVSMEIIYTRAK